MGETKRKRTSLIEDLDDSLDLTKVVSKTVKKEPFTKEIKEQVVAASESVGFVSRQPKKTHRKRIKSPFTEPAGFRMRPEIKILFQELSDSMTLRDHTTFEIAFEALLVKLDKKELLKRFNEITNS